MHALGREILGLFRPDEIRAPRAIKCRLARARPRTAPEIPVLTNPLLLADPHARAGARIWALIPISSGAASPNLL